MKAHNITIKLSNLQSNLKDQYKRLGVHDGAWDLEIPGGKDKGANTGIIATLKAKFQKNVGNVKVYFKKISPHKAISEIFSSEIYKVLGVPASESFLAKGAVDAGGNMTSSDVIYTGSIFLDGFREIYKELGYESRPSSVRPQDAQTIAERYQGLNNNSLERVLAVTLWLGDRDVHTGNLGVIKTAQGEVLTAAKIDHDWGMAFDSDELSPMKSQFQLHWRGFKLKGRPRNNQSQLALDKERSLYVSENFVTAAQGLVNNIHAKRAELEQAIDSKLDEAEEYFGLSGLKDFAGKKLGMALRRKETALELKGRMKTLLVDRLLVQRMASLAKFASEIEVDLSIKYVNGQYEIDEARLKRAIETNPTYFEELKVCHFRSPQHQQDAKKLNTMVKEAMAVLKFGVIEERIAAYHSDKKLPEVAKICENYYQALSLSKSLGGDHKLKLSKVRSFTYQALTMNKPLLKSTLLDVSQHKFGINLVMKQVSSFTDLEGKKIEVGVDDKGLYHIQKNSQFTGVITIARAGGKERDLLVVTHGQITDFVEADGGKSTLASLTEYRALVAAKIQPQAKQPVLKEVVKKLAQELRDPKATDKKDQRHITQAAEGLMNEVLGKLEQAQKISSETKQKIITSKVIEALSSTSEAYLAANRDSLIAVMTAKLQDGLHFDLAQKSRNHISRGVLEELAFDIRETFAARSAIATEFQKANTDFNNINHDIAQIRRDLKSDQPDLLAIAKRFTEVENKSAKLDLKSIDDYKKMQEKILGEIDALRDETGSLPTKLDAKHSSLLKTIAMVGSISDALTGFRESNRDIRAQLGNHYRINLGAITEILSSNIRPKQKVVEIEQLFAQCAGIGSANEAGQTLLGEICQKPIEENGFYGNGVELSDVIKLLLKNPQTESFINRPDNEGRTSLIHAVLQKRTSTVLTLLNKNADPHFVDKSGKNALLYAIEADEVDIVKLLLNKGAKAPVVLNKNNYEASVNKYLNEKGLNKIPSR